MFTYGEMIRIKIPFPYTDIFSILKQRRLTACITGEHLLCARYDIPVAPPFLIVTPCPTDAVNAALSQAGYAPASEKTTVLPQPNAVQIQYAPNVKDSLQDQLFTVLAAVADENGKVFCSEKSLYDITHGFLRCQNTITMCLENNPIHKLAALRLIAQFEQLTLHDELYKAIEYNPSLFGVSKHTIAREMNKLLMGDNAPAALLLLRDLHLLEEIFPDLMPCVGASQNEYHTKDVYGHIADVVGNTPSERLELRMAALFHDICKPQCKMQIDGKIRFPNHAQASADLCAKILHDYGYPKAFINNIYELISHHMKKQAMTDEELLEMIRRLGAQTAKDIIALQIADNAATLDPARQGMRNNQRRLSELLCEINV